jgi:hypothetical protein
VPLPINRVGRTRRLGAGARCRCNRTAVAAARPCGAGLCDAEIVGGRARIHRCELLGCHRPRESPSGGATQRPVTEVGGPARSSTRRGSGGRRRLEALRDRCSLSSRGRTSVGAVGADRWRGDRKGFECLDRFATELIFASQLTAQLHMTGRLRGSGDGACPTCCGCLRPHAPTLAHAAMWGWRRRAGRLPPGRRIVRVHAQSKPLTLESTGAGHHCNATITQAWNAHSCTVIWAGGGGGGRGERKRIRLSPSQGLLPRAIAGIAPPPARVLTRAFEVHPFTKAF